VLVLGLLVAGAMPIARGGSWYFLIAGRCRPGLSGADLAPAGHGLSRRPGGVHPAVAAQGSDTSAGRFAALDQINAGNVAQLAQVWVFRTGDIQQSTGAGAEDQLTPMRIGDKLFLGTPGSNVTALDVDIPDFGSQGGPITFKSPDIDRQYAVISAGGARQSPDRGDYVIAYALPASTR